MPRHFKKRYKKRRKGALTKRVNAIARKLKGEWKLNDTNNLSVYTPMSALGTAYSCCRIAQGASDRERIGDSVKLRSILVRGELQSATAGVVRVLLVVHRVSSGAAFVPQDMWQQAAAGECIYSPRATSTTQHYRVLMDKHLWTAARAELDVSAKPFKIFKKLQKPLTVKYRGIGSTVGDIDANHLYLVFFGDAITPRCDVKFHMRVRYTEN